MRLITLRISLSMTESLVEYLLLHNNLTEFVIAEL